MDGLTWNVYSWTSAGYQLLHLHTVDKQSNPPPKSVSLKILGTVWLKLPTL